MNHIKKQKNINIIKDRLTCELMLNDSDMAYINMLIDALNYYTGYNKPLDMNFLLKYKKYE